MHNIVIISLPRSGSSMLAGLIASAGYSLELTPRSTFVGGSPFNEDGYLEEVGLTLLNDQIIRLQFGISYSNLHLPECPLPLCPDLRAGAAAFEYDLDETTVYFPETFRERIAEFTGAPWDVWGLTRMVPGGKWHRAYARHGVARGEGVLAKLHEYSAALNRSSGVVVKDPRLGITLGHYQLDTRRHRVIRIDREPDEVLRSMRRHYGQGIFTDNVLPGPRRIVSNHFNYGIGPQSFEEYRRRYETFILANLQGFDVLHLKYAGLVDGSQIGLLEDFIGRPVDRSRLRRPL